MTADKVRAIVEAAERSASELEAAAREEAVRVREQAERETEAQLRRAHALADSLSARAAELERALEDVGGRIRGAIEALREELEELRSANPAPAPPPNASTEVSTADQPDASPEASAADQPDSSAEAPPPSEPDAVADASEQSSPDVSAETSAPSKPDDTPPPGPEAEGARVIALNMALNGASREETASYLSENFELEDPEALLDDVYARAGG